MLKDVGVMKSAKQERCEVVVNDDVHDMLLKNRAIFVD